MQDQKEIDQIGEGDQPKNEYNNSSTVTTCLNTHNEQRQQVATANNLKSTGIDPMLPKP